MRYLSFYTIDNIKRYFISILLFNVSTLGIASEKDNIIIYTPTYQPELIMGSANLAGHKNTSNNNVKNEVEPGRIANYINSTRLAFCGKSKNTDVKIWIKYDASAKAFGIIGGGIENGLEVTYHCK